MKTKTIQLLSAIMFIAITSILYTGCKKDDPTPADANAASDNAIADNAFSGVWKQVGTVADDSSNTLKSAASKLAACASVTITPFDTTWPKTVEVNFGTTNCLGNDKVNRRGIITAVFSGPYAASGTVITITTTNFYHNDYKVEGTQTITNKGRNVAGNLVYNVVVTNAKITHPDGKTSSWNTNQNREWLHDGETTTFNIFDDVYLISGYATGVSVKGEPYTITINTDLRIEIGCPWIVSGKFTLLLTKYPTYPITLDYGTGDCDALATATLNGKTYNVILH